MSIDRCSRCGRLIDTDYDLECYLPDPRHSLVGHPDICVCEPCREREEAESNIIEFPASEMDQLIGSGVNRI